MQAVAVVDRQATFTGVGGFSGNLRKRKRKRKRSSKPNVSIIAANPQLAKDKEHVWFGGSFNV